MTEGTDTPTDTQVAEAPANVETSTQEVKTPENETAKTDEAAQADAEQAEGDAESTDSEKPKRVSGYDRMKRKNQHLQNEILRLQEEVNKSTAAIEGEKPPREEDFNGDYFAWQRALTAFDVKQELRKENARIKDEQRQEKTKEIRAEIAADFEERAETFKAKAKDFDQVIGKFIDAGGSLAPVVRELVMESDVGPELAYHLAKHPGIANKVNSLPPLQAAKEIARLEDSLSRPSNRATKAPPPLKTPTGGASAPVDLATLAKSEDASDYIRMRQQQMK